MENVRIEGYDKDNEEGRMGMIETEGEEVERDVEREQRGFMGLQEKEKLVYNQARQKCL